MSFELLDLTQFYEFEAGTQSSSAGVTGALVISTITDVGLATFSPPGSHGMVGNCVMATMTSAGFAVVGFHTTAGLAIGSMTLSASGSATTPPRTATADLIIAAATTLGLASDLQYAADANLVISSMTLGSRGKVPDLILHSPAQLIKKILIDAGIADDPQQSTWPVYTSQEPSRPDDVITVYDTTGRSNGRTMIDGEQAELFGVQVRIRSAIYNDGWAKGWEVARTFDQQMPGDVFSLGIATYRVTNISRIGQVITIGNESPRSRRRLFALNALINARRIG